jgi:hypothetical protein
MDDMLAHEEDTVADIAHTDVVSAVSSCMGLTPYTPYLGLTNALIYVSCLQEDMDDMLAHEEDLGGEELGGANAAAHYRDLELRRGDNREQTEEEMAKYIEEKYK